MFMKSTTDRNIHLRSKRRKVTYALFEIFKKGINLPIHIYLRVIYILSSTLNTDWYDFSAEVVIKTANN